MKKVFVFLITFMILWNCGKKDEITKVPKLISAKVTNTYWDPKDRIDFTTKGETDADIEIQGENFGGEYMIVSFQGAGSCENIKVYDSNRLTCHISFISSAGQHKIKARNMESDWSTDEVYITVY